MATPQLSPGVLVREVDLTVGRADNVLDNIGGIAGPFKMGPVEWPITITTEQDLINTFGKPISTDNQYEYWMSAASYLSYGGILKVVRTNGSNLNCANAGVSIASTNSVNVKNYEDYILNFKTATNFTYSAKNAGSWSNNLKVCYIDGIADQTIGISTNNLSLAGAIVGHGVTAAVTGVLPGAGTTSVYTGYIKGIITGVSTDATNSASTVDVKVVARITNAGTATTITYAEGGAFNSFDTSDSVRFINSSGIATGHSAAAAYTPATAVDWYDQQTLSLTNATISWKSIAPKPTTSVYASDRQALNDECHVVVVDDIGSVTGIKGNIIEKHIGLSKAADAISNVNAPQSIYYKDYLADYSENIYAGYSPSVAGDSYHGTTPRATGFSAIGGYTAVTTAAGTFGLDAQDVTFGAVGNVTYTLAGGVDYQAGGGMKADLGDIITAYNKLSNEDEEEVDFLIMGPGCTIENETQAKANKLIAIAGERKDCVACVGPHRTNLVGVTNSDTQTTNLMNYFSPLSSSSYAVFDSGYKFTYDRFNKTFVYIPTNADVAGLMARTSLNSYPWFSPAGLQRGVINNAVKLAYNPTKAQRDKLYPNRINSFITQPGSGTVLFGDKTALAYASAFDRINVRRLFLTVEQALKSAADSQLFEINDDLTRANFRAIVEPYLRDVQAKRGLYGFAVICDSTNNTPDIIDNNEFRADIFLKPTKAINYVTLTFVATRTGISFSEVTGRV